MILPLIHQALETFLAPPPKLTVCEWAELYRRLGRDVTAKPGRYRVANAPYQKKPQEDFTNPEVQVEVFMWASRLGKTEILNNLEGFVIDVMPMGILVFYPTLDSAKKWSKEFFAPMVRATPRLRGKIREARSRDSNNTILSKQFPGGKISAIGANSPSGFRQIQAPVVIGDEIDAMESGAEGDPVTLAFRRADNYPNSIQVLSSTPTRKNQSRIESWMEKSDYQKWFCPCPACGVFQVLMRSQVKFDEAKPEEALMLCQHCKSELTDAQRVEMILKGEWRATRTFGGVRGYWLNGMNTLFAAKKGFRNKLHQIASEAIEAKRQGDAALMVLTNTFDAETYDDPGETIDLTGLMSRCEDYGAEVPEDCLMLTGSADVQGDRIESHVWGFGLGEEAWHIKKAVFLGNPLLPKVWAELDAFLAQQFEDKHKNRFRIIRTFIDMRHKPKEVCAFVRRRAPLIYACYGADTLQHQVAVKKKRNSYGAVPFCIGVETVKDILFSRLKLADMGPRYIHFRDGTSQEFFEQLTAEKKVTKLRFGFPESHYEKIRPRNEDLDLTVYAFAAMDTLKPNLEVLAKNLASQRKKVVLESGIYKSNESNTPEPQAPSKVQPPKRPPSPPRRSFVAGWKKF